MIHMVEKLYDKLKNSFQTLIHKVRGNSYKDSLATKETKELIQSESLKKMEVFIDDAQADKSKVIK